MRVLARSLLVLEDLGCVKQVKAQAQTQTPNPFYFRCVKFFREPVEKEWQLLAAPNRAPLSSSRVRENGDVDAGEDTDNHLPIEKSARLITIDEDTSVEILRGFGRSIPQWTADRCMNNFLYDLIQQSGTQGISSMVSVSGFSLRERPNIIAGNQRACHRKIREKAVRVPAFSAGRSLANFAALAPSTFGDYKGQRLD